VGQVHPGRSCDIFSKALRYPLCSKPVFEALYRKCGWNPVEGSAPELPRRLFRFLSPKTAVTGRVPDWNEGEHPLPFLKYLYSTPVAPDPNSHKGYALTKAVSARFYPLIRFLMDHGASPHHRHALAVKVAIRQKNLPLVKMLIERSAEIGRGKKRRLQDRIIVTPDLLKAAVICGAGDIVEYFSEEKACVPDMQTLQLLWHTQPCVSTRASECCELIDLLIRRN